jgi:ATP-dependent Clp protease ATP-binding subunit ClpB
VNTSSTSSATRALERRFQMVKVDEPDDDTACLMLRGLKSRYADHHGVHIG